MKAKLLATSGLFITLLATAANAGVALKFSSDVPKEHQQLIQADLALLARQNISINSPELNRVMDLNGVVTSNTLSQWLSQRVKYIVGKDFELNENSLAVVQTGYSFQNPGLTPDVPARVSTPGKDTSANGKPVRVVMTNVGSAIYVVSKMTGALLAVKTPGSSSKITVTSPRVGIIQIGEGLFVKRSTQLATSTLTDIENSLARISTMFHEARHSDGNGKTLGMMHAICPKGHSYAGFGACDFSLNGSYSVGAYSMKAMAENCSDCNAAQKEVLRLDYMDSFSRIISEKKAEASSGPSELETLELTKSTCDSVRKFIVPLPEYCVGIEAKIAAAKSGEGHGPVVKAQFLDSRPEGI
jgi:hypothetical protein